MTLSAEPRTHDNVASSVDIRAGFPALARRHNGQLVAYFDGPGGTQVPRSVADAMVEYLLHHNANTHWRYPTSEETDRLIAEARAALADYLGADATEIVFGANMTTLTFHLARALGRAWGPGDEIVVTELDHHANVAPWRALERERGVTIRAVPVIPATGELDWPSLERALSGRTRLLAIGAASNALGTITDVTRACASARAAGALSFVDAVHYAAHAAVDVRAIGCDFLVCSAYKFYGPHIGVLYGQRARLEALDVPKLAPAPETAPERLETGTLNHEGIVGAAAAVEFLASLATGGSRRDRLVRASTALHQRGRALFERLWDGLRGIEGVVLYGPPPGRPRTPTVAFTVTGCTSDEVAVALARDGVFVSNGDFYATTVVERLGLGAHGLVRAGCACYTTADEVDRLVAGVRAVARSVAR
ncbi:MAG TPA: cysteine desulfurase-like protein [Gemmatimonadales bacterium]|nr:cysteine desulfurase-like protein [Gemmatimonadales bacterium]